MKELLLAIDIGNVCVQVDHNKFAETLGITEIPQSFRDLARDYEFGKIKEESAFLESALQIFEGKFSAKELKEAFNAILIKPVDGMVDLVNAFPSYNVKAVFFSDISPTHLQRTRELFPAFDAVAGGVFSFECGNWKPSAEMLGAFEKRCGIPDLYVDDRKELVEGARLRSWNAEVFAGAEDLLEKLLALS